MKTLFPFLRCALLYCATAHAAMPAAKSAAFVQDLDLLARELPKRHANLFHSSSREKFVEEVANLRARLPGLDRAAAIVALAGLVGLAQDGHTSP